MNGTAALRGSQRWLQIAVNRCPDVVDGAISRAIGLRQDETIEWLSPLESEDFIEYRDQAFLERLGINPRHRQLSDFWPRRGPVWDGLAQTSAGRSLIIEAKANLPEFDSNPTGASGRSLSEIRESLDETRSFLRVTSGTDWTRCFYQYANRLAHLYFLRELNAIDAVLVFVYFTGDTTVPSVDPVAREGWEAAVGLATNHLGIRLSSPWIRENVFDVFVDVNDLSHICWP